MEHEQVNGIQLSNGQYLTRLFFRVLPAQIFLLLFSGLNSVVDGLIGSNLLGPAAMSTIGLYSPFLMIWMAVSTTLMVSAQVLCARYMGAGDAGKTRGVFSLNITVALVVLAIATLASFLFPRGIAGLLGAAPDSADDVSGYVMGMGIGLIPVVLGQQFGAFLSLEGQNRRNYIAAASMLAVNIALDLLFILVFHMGIRGLAIATSLGNWAYMLVSGSFFLTKKASLKYSFKAINWRELGSMLNLGFPSALLTLLTAVRGGLFNIALSAYDPAMMAVAALSTFTLAYMIFQSIGQGMASAGRMLTSVCYGEEDRRAVSMVMKTALTKGFILLLVAAVLELALAGVITGLFFADKTSAVYTLAVKGVRIGAGILVLQSIGSIFSSYYQAIGRMKIVNIMSVLEGIAVMGPMGMLLIPKIGLDGVWISMLAGYAVVALCGPVYALLYWKRVPRTMSEWVTIPEDFGASDEERIDISICSREDAVNTSRRILDFCRGRHIDEKRSYYSALALEELACKIIDARFGEDKKRHAIEVRAVDRGEEIILSLKDDCPPFNPQEREEIINPPEDLGESASIRIFMGITKKSEYQLVLGLNVFTVTV